VVKIETNSPDPDGSGTMIYGVGENTPLGSFYLPAFPEGTRAGIRVLAPHLIGRNPTRLNEINDFMDRILKGHPYVKSAIDMACWDILGKLSSLPVAELMGGRYDHLGCDGEVLHGYPLYRAISQRSAEEMAQNVAKYVDQGYRKIQLKVGGGVEEDINRIRAVRKMLDEKAVSEGLHPSSFLLM
jgi:L-alanine-DL-glutamate epimerase-like enolase superfamily enzyme